MSTTRTIKKIIFTGDSAVGKTTTKFNWWLFRPLIELICWVCEFGTVSCWDEVEAVLVREITQISCKYELLTNMKKFNLYLK